METPDDSIEAQFDYEEIEEKSLMVVYNDVLPFGDELKVTINGENYIIFDQYCVLPWCSCTESGLTVCPVTAFNETAEGLFSITLDYVKKKWGMPKEQSESFNKKTVISAVEEQIPDLCRKLLNRHKRLKGIYAHCREHYFEQLQQFHPPKIGRNDPCPCGSGKKYKNCCLRKSI